MIDVPEALAVALRVGVSRGLGTTQYFVRARKGIHVKVTNGGAIKFEAEVNAAVRRMNQAPDMRD